VATTLVNRQAVREHLERVLLSNCFARSERVSKLLRYLVERRLEGRESDLKESIIGVEVFGRKPGYDPKVDSTVRTEAARLRTRLSKYYSTEGSQDPVVIELPKGGYVPVFRQRGAAPAVQRTSFKPRLLAVGVATLGLATTAIAVGWVVLHQKAPIAIAVLPLLNLNQDIASDYLADGLTSEIISDLSIIDGLAVRSQTSSFALKGKPHNVREAGGQLEADYIVEGSVLRAGEQLRINVQLVRTHDDVPVWSDKLEREMIDIVSIQDEISRGIVNNLRLKLGRGRRRYETSVEAYDLYLRARATWAQRLPSDPEVIDLLKKVTDKDPSFAPAFAGLAVAFAVQSFLSARGPGHAEALEKMRAAGERAIQLDPLLAEAHTALGAAYAREGQWQQAEQSFRRAIQIDPNSSFAHQWLARFFLWPCGRIEEAVREMRAAERNDPLSPMAHMELADALLSAGRFDDAASQCEKAPADNGRRNECLGRARLAQRRIAEAIPLLAASSTQNWGYLAYAYAKAGRREEAEKLMIEGPALYPNRRGAFQFALAFAGFEDKDRTIERLERWTGVGPVRMGFTLNSPEFAFLRGDPRVKALRNRLGLPG
jgi:TolB-like protein/Flp pilus assembly protein TadD